MNTIKSKSVFVLKLLAFLLVFVCASELANTLYIKTVLSHSLLYRADAQFEAVKEDIRILVAGDSHPREDVNPQFLERSFVVASAGESIIQTYYRLDYWINRQQLDIELVLLPIDLHSFSSFRGDRFEHNDFWRKYINYRELGAAKGRPLTHALYRLEGEFAYLDGVDETISSFKAADDNMQHSQLVNGHIAGNYVSSKSRFPESQVKWRVEQHLRSNRRILDPDLVTYFLKTIAMLNANDIQVVLVRYPVSRQYFSMAQKFVDVPDFYAQIDELLAQQGAQVSILDYHDLFWQDIRYFNNPNHLNADGSEVFTRKLKIDLAQLGALP